MSSCEKIRKFESFWRGEGPCLLLIPTSDMPLYDLTDYPKLFANPQAMWDSEIRRARPSLGWPTDGIPTVRPNLGVIFVPSLAGLSYRLKEGQMPWPGDPLEMDQIRAARDLDVAEAPVMKLADDFYAIHEASGESEVVAYAADTQGVFDIAHLLRGDALLYDMADPDAENCYEEVMEISLDLYVRASQYLKARLEEKPDAMVHGHGCAQGVHFPHAGVRISEDTATLASPRMIDERIMPHLERSLARFGGGFAHFCGKHDALLERLCRSPWVKAIDLGNPEMVDPRWLMERCAETDTVLFSRLSSRAGESWEGYVRRLARLTCETGCRSILRPAIFPNTREECQAMLDLWHELTVVRQNVIQAIQK